MDAEAQLGTHCLHPLRPGYLFPRGDVLTDEPGFPGDCSAAVMGGSGPRQVLGSPDSATWQQNSFRSARVTSCLCTVPAVCSTAFPEESPFCKEKRGAVLGTGIYPTVTVGGLWTGFQRMGPPGVPGGFSR